MEGIQVSTPHPEVMRVAEHKSIFGSLVFFLLLFATSIYLFFEVEAEKLTCRRLFFDRPPECEMTYTSLTRTRTLPIGNLKGASIEESCDDEGCTSYTLVKTNWGVYDLAGTDAARQIEGYLSQADQTELVITENTLAWGGRFFGALTFFVGSSILIFSFLRPAFIFDKRIGKLKIYKVGLFQYRVTEIPLISINSIQLEEKNEVDSDGDPVTNYYVSLVGRSLDPIRISFLPCRELEELQKLAHRLGSFLGVPVRVVKSSAEAQEA
ncbi:MAG: hypothetical protein Q6K55_12190 [Thermostichus sp. DG02_3_bins_51]